jgi:hypothetical protein
MVDKPNYSCQRYTRSVLLKLYTTATPPAFSCDSIRWAGLWTKCYIYVSLGQLFIRRYRGRRAGCSNRNVQRPIRTIIECNRQQSMNRCLLQISPNNISPLSNLTPNQMAPRHCSSISTSYFWHAEHTLSQ